MPPPSPAALGSEARDAAGDAPTPLPPPTALGSEARDAAGEAPTPLPFPFKRSTGRSVLGVPDPLVVPFSLLEPFVVPFSLLEPFVVPFSLLPLQVRPACSGSSHSVALLCHPPPFHPVPLHSPPLLYHPPLLWPESPRAMDATRIYKQAASQSGRREKSGRHALRCREHRSRANARCE
jgi:hypothetical protein